MDLYIEAALWFGMIMGCFALLGLLSAGVERWAEAVEEWADSIASDYADD